MFVIAGASGHTGSVVASTLLGRARRCASSCATRRRASRGSAQGAEVAVADLDDAEALATALAGADGVYALVPPDTGRRSVGRAGAA